MKMQAFLTDLSEVMEVECSELTDTFCLDENSNWDSLTRVSAIAMIDEHFQLSLEYRDLRDCRSVGDLMSLIDEKKSNKLSINA